MILIFSIVLYPIFFIISYVIAEYIYPTKNGAMLFSLLSAFVISYLYYTIRTKVRQLTDKKNNKKRIDESQLVSLLFVESAVFMEKFPKNSLTDNSFIGITEDKIIKFMRKNSGDIHIYSVRGISDSTRDFLNALNKKFTVHSADEILALAKDLVSNPEIKKVTVLTKIKKVIFTKEFKKFSIKYGVILLLLSIITPYKIYYILFGSSLLIFGLSQKLLKRINQRNQIPYPQS